MQNAHRRTEGRRFSYGLAAIALAGFVGRVVYVVLLRDRAVGGDGPGYRLGSIYLADGLGYINPLVRLATGVDVPDALHPPAWLTLLALPSSLGFRSYLSHQLFACAVGTATVAMTGIAGREAFGRRAGLVAAGVVAIYPNVWLYERELAAETLALFAVAVTIWLAYRFRSKPSTGRAAVLGLSVGALTMTRPEMLALAAFLVLPLVLGAGIHWRRRLASLAAATVCCAVVIAPWAVYNTTRFDRPVPLTTSLGSAMLQGNCEQTYHGELLGYYRLGCAVLRTGFSSDRSVADAEQREAALDFMRDNASRVPIVVAARVGRTFGVFRPFQQVHLDADRNTPLPVIRLGLFVFWALLPLGVAGAVLARRRGVPVYPLFAFPLAVLLSVLLTIGQTRYRAPAEIPLAILAAVAIDAALRWWQRWSRRAVDPTARTRAASHELEHSVH
jgi:4-amino-4-deoxy-L-arabinose transferase-like glycosyltransferase